MTVLTEGSSNLIDRTIDPSELRENLTSSLLQKTAVTDVLFVPCINTVREDQQQVTGLVIVAVES
jgi:hypothetical protein